jgi:fructose-1,6-bisphosphatase I
MKVGVKIRSFPPHPSPLPSGRAAPLAMIVEQAGGSATDGRMQIMDIEPQEIHQRVPLFIGSKNDVEKAMEFYRESEKK